VFTGGGGGLFGGGCVLGGSLGGESLFGAGGATVVGLGGRGLPCSSCPSLGILWRATASQSDMRHPTALTRIFSGKNK
jgi:hypothetical protein